MAIRTPPRLTGIRLNRLAHIAVKAVLPLAGLLLLETPGDASGAGRVAASRPASAEPGDKPGSPTPAVLSQYAQLFGDEERKVLSTPATRDDAAFAAKLLAHAAKLKDDPDLRHYMLGRVVEMGKKDSDGIASAIDATNQLIVASDGAEKLVWQAKAVELYDLQYKRATGATRAEAGKFLLGMLADEADSLAVQGKYADAGRRLTDARTIATTIHSPRLDELSTRLKLIQERQATLTRLEKLTIKLDTAGSDIKLLEQVILGYLVELEDPTTAGKLAGRDPDKEWERMIGLAAKPEKEMTEVDHQSLAEWYQTIADKAAESQKAAVLQQSFTHYAAFLDMHPRQDAVRLSAAAASEKVGAALQALGVGVVADRVVLWNTHNGPANDRGAKVVNLTLTAKGKTVYVRQGVEVPWKANADTSVTVALPNVTFDTVRIDMVSWNRSGGGLAEVQVFHGQSNLAKGGRAQASASWSADLGPQNLTDGVSSSAEFKGSWQLPDRTAGWATVEVRRAP